MRSFSVQQANQAETCSNRRRLPSLNRRIVGIQVAGQTVGELGMQRGIVRHLAVALAALRNHCMLLMAGHA